MSWPDWFWRWWHHRHDLARVELRLRKRRHGKWRRWRMNLTVLFGETVEGDIRAFTALDLPHLIPEGATVALTSNEVAVATVPATVPVPVGGAADLTFDVTILAPGSTDIHVVLTTPDGTFEDTATLTVTPAPEPGIAKVTLTLRRKVPTPTPV